MGALGLRSRSETDRAGGSVPARAALERGSLKSGIGIAAGVAAGSAALFGIPSPIHLHAPGARAAIETLIASSALLGAALLLVAYRQRHHRSDLLLFAALATVGLTDFAVSAVPALTGSQLLGFGSAAQVTCDAMGAIAVAAAAFSAGDSPTRTDHRALLFAGLVTVATIATASALDLLGEPALFSSGVLILAGVAFLQRPQPSAYALAGAAFLLAAARLQYLALPATAADWVTARDALRLVAFALLLLAAIARYARTRRAIAAGALAVERERIARDLHDGLAQDLAFIALQGQRLESELGTEHPLSVAARRALAASRGVIVDLSASNASATDIAVRQVADELAARFGIEVDVRILCGSEQRARDDLDRDRREDVVRISREAIVNAVRHGGANRVAVLLDGDGDQLRLRVTDNGRGIPQAKPPGPRGYGLQMMRARAASLGGCLTTRQRPEGGTEIEVRFPFAPPQHRLRRYAS